jgi:hypothetical protein
LAPLVLLAGTIPLHVLASPRRASLIVHHCAASEPRTHELRMWMDGWMEGGMEGWRDGGMRVAAPLFAAVKEFCPRHHPQALL